MARTALKVVEQEKPKSKAKSNRWQDNDTVLFHKRQIHIGTKLRYWGRIDHGVQWEVVRIVGQNGVKRTTAQFLNDTVYLKKGSEIIVKRFSTISYYATWRLV